MSMVELVIVLTVVAIAVRLAMPSINAVMQSNRVATQLNAFAGDLQYARSEAIRQGRFVTVCASVDGTRCSGVNEWHKGWIVFTDPQADQIADATDPLLRRQAALTNGDTFTGSAGTSAVTFSRDGFAVGLTQGLTMTMATTPVNPSATRCLSLNVTGFVTASTGSCS